MSGYRELVLDALRALRIDSPTHFSWLGEPGPELPADVASAMDEATARDYLRFTLQNHLYASFYTRGAPGPARPAETLQPDVGWTPFLSELSAANAGSRSREPGWIVDRRDADGRIVVRRNGLSLWARPEEVVGPADPEAEVSIRLPKELLRLSPGFYLALGEEEFQPDEPVVRVYWHLRREGAPRLVRELTAPLNAGGLPFRLKVLKDPNAYSRCDAGVLYVRSRDFRRVAPLVARTRSAVEQQLRDTTPALTKRLGDGVGLAEEPPSAESFGMHRCGLLAEGAIRAWEAGAERAEDALPLVEAGLGEAGISLDAPYLNPGSDDRYELPA
jgi:HopA1 effector protein family